jgi:TRAP-type C4-dicarboxylate transport system permease small subunit
LDRAPPPKAIAALLAAIDRIERVVVLVAFALLAGAVFADVLLRELTGVGIAPARELAVFAMVAVALLGMDLATRDGLHLRPRFADGWLPGTWQPWLGRVSDLVAAAILGTLAAFAAIVVAETFALDERSPVLRVPIAPIQLLLPLAFGLMALRHLLGAIWPAVAPASGGER